MYGDEQGTGPYEDTYLIDNIARSLRAGSYDHPASPDLAPSGLYIGMIPGGNLVPGSHCLREADSIVVVTDQNFARGYHQGQRYAVPLTDTLLMQQLHQFAAQGVQGSALAYELGCIIGSLSLAIIPVSVRSV